ncbi:MAG: peptide ABC transporter substrate-binding protein [Bauldia sp.]
MKTALTAALLLVMSLFAATASAQTLYERGNSTDPVTLDPQLSVSAAEANILRDLYEGLVIHSPDGLLVAGVAESWEVSADGLVWTFHLRDSDWSDGSPVTAADFVHAFRRLFDPALEAPDARLFLTIAGAADARSGEAKTDTVGVRAVDDRTLTITLAEPTPQLLQLLARPSALPVHRDLAEVPAVPDLDSPFNGAYRFDGFVPGDGTYLIKNLTYYAAGTVYFDTVIYRPFEIQLAMQAFINGTLLSNNDVAIFGLADRAEELADSLRHTRFLGTFFLATNLDGPLEDARVRRAVALAIDRNRLATEIWRDTVFATRAILPADMPTYPVPAETDLGANERDERVATAIALLDDAGFTAANPLTLTLAIPATQINGLTAQAIAEDLAEAGITLNILDRDPGEHYDAIGVADDYDLATVAWIGDSEHPVDVLGLFDEAGGRFTAYANPEYDALLAEAALTADRTVATALYAAADRLLVRDLPAIPLLQYGAYNLVSPRLAGFEDNVVDVHLTRWLSLAQ